MLSDAPKLKNLPSNRRRATAATTNKHYSDSQKIEAVTTYLSLGNLVLTASVLKIPEMTLRSWKSKQWWKDIEGELALQDELQLSSRLKRIVESTLNVAEDRIAHGDFIYDNKTGSMIRRPVSLRDAHKVTMDMIDKREHLMGKVPQNVSIEAIDDKLKKLAEKFEQIANAKNQPVIEVTDVIIGEVVDGE